MKQATSGVLGYLDAFQLQLELAYSNKMTDNKIRWLIEMLFPYPKPGGTRELMSRDRIDSMREEFYDTYYLASDNYDFRETGMGFLNAYYDYLSHRGQTKNMNNNWNDRRLSGLVSGSDIKTKVINKAML